jgi:hypothetical protein
MQRRHPTQRVDPYSGSVWNLNQEESDKLDALITLKHNWFMKNIMPHYKDEVCRYHNTTPEEYDRRTIGDESIYLPQPNNKFDATFYCDRVAHVVKVKRGEFKDKIVGVNPETGWLDRWRDEDPNAVF